VRVPGYQTAVGLVNGHEYGNGTAKTFGSHLDHLGGGKAAVRHIAWRKLRRPAPPP
jgi:hypothetical protein